MKGKKCTSILIRERIYDRAPLCQREARNESQISKPERHHFVNRPEQPCEEEEDYDFLECVKTSQARMVGCRPPWDIWSPHTLPLCQTMDQLQQYEKLEESYFYQLEIIVTMTGCRVTTRSAFITIVTRSISFVKFGKNFVQ